MVGKDRGQEGEIQGEATCVMFLAEKVMGIWEAEENTVQFGEENRWWCLGLSNEAGQVQRAKGIAGVPLRAVSFMKRGYCCNIGKKSLWPNEDMASKEISQANG